MIKTQTDGKYGDEIMDVEVDWQDELNGRTIVEDSIVVTAAGEATFEAEHRSFDGRYSIVRVSGGGVFAKSATRINLIANTNTGEKAGGQVYVPILAR